MNRETHQDDDRFWIWCEDENYKTYPVSDRTFQEAEPEEGWITMKGGPIDGWRIKWTEPVPDPVTIWAYDGSAHQYSLNGKYLGPV